jgi:transcription initiation factor TFIIH subunit 2
VYLALDFSSAMRERDLKPDRLRHCVKLAQEFVKEYFDQNPISQLVSQAPRL